MKKIKIYIAYAGSEDNEGVARWSEIAKFTNHDDALKAVKGKHDGWRGKRDGKVEPGEIEIFDSFEEYQDSKKAQLKKEALNKLTQEEIDALGIDRE